MKQFNMNVHVLEKDSRFTALEYDLSADTLVGLMAKILDNGPVMMKPCPSPIWCEYALAEPNVKHHAGFVVQSDNIRASVDFVLRKARPDEPIPF